MLRPPLFYLPEDARFQLWSLVGLYLVVEWFIAAIFRAGRRGQDRTDDRGSLGLFVMVLPISWFAAITASGWPWGFFGSATLFRVGLVVLGAGMLLRWWSIATLGRLFTVNVAIRSEHRLIESGPYHFVRHPSYSAILLVHIGTALSLGNVVSLGLLTVPLLATLVYRMRVEEDVLMAGLGEAYRGYMARTKRLIPGLY